LLCVSVLLSCKTNSTTMTETKQSDDIEKTKKNNIFCPEDGKCTLEVIANASLILKEDTIGKIYPEITSGNKFVFVYTYTRNTSGLYQDEAYSETIHFELSPNDDNRVFEDIALQKVNAIYGKHCFCRGQAGFYNIEKGTLKTGELKNEAFQFEFSIPNVSHVVNNVGNSI